MKAATPHAFTSLRIELPAESVAPLLAGLGYHPLDRIRIADRALYARADWTSLPVMVERAPGTERLGLLFPQIRF